MRIVAASQISETVARLYQEANFRLPADTVAALERARALEQSAAGKAVLDRILENTQIAARERIPLCQDCGTTTVFVEIGQEACIAGGGLEAAINDGVRRACQEGCLRHSMVTRPFSARLNTGDNTPAVIHTEVVPGDRVKLGVLAKGAGSENLARLGMLSPAAGRQGVIDLVARAVDEAGGNPCPPLIVGVGIGGSAEKCLLLAKKSLLRQVGECNADPENAALERDILNRVNDLGIGPMGYGGTLTALAVHVETFPCHIASLPVGVSLQCHSARHQEACI